VLGLEGWQGLDKVQKNAPRCLLFALISLPLNDRRRQGIGILSSSQRVVYSIMRSVYLYYIHHRFNHGTYLHGLLQAKVALFKGYCVIDQ
jgi:hypothetical protein